jgi:hypothetical protein
MKRLRPKSWNEFQHYKRRHPPWVKLHKRLLDDFEFQSLPLASKALAPMLWLLASEDRQGWIDAEAAKISFRLRISEEELDQAIRPLIEGGFFEHEEDASAVLALDMQQALPETETETESEEETEELSDKSDPCEFSLLDKEGGETSSVEAWSGPASPVRAKRADGGGARSTLSSVRRAKGETKYPEGFLAFWREYPTDMLMSKKRALEQWEKLSPIEREAAHRAIPAFKEYCRKHLTYRPVHAERFLSQKRFEGFAQSAALSATEIEANKDRADRLMRRGKYAVSYQ